MTADTFKGRKNGLEVVDPDSGSSHLFHHEVGHVAEPLLADGTGLQALVLAGTADDVTLPALDDGRSDPIVTDWAVEMADESLVVHQTAVGSQRWALARQTETAGQVAQHVADGRAAEWDGLPSG